MNIKLIALKVVTKGFTSTMKLPKRYERKTKEVTKLMKRFNSYKANVTNEYNSMLSKYNSLKRVDIEIELMEVFA